MHSLSFLVIQVRESIPGESNLFGFIIEGFTVHFPFRVEQENLK